MNYNVTLCCCSFWEGCREPCVIHCAISLALFSNVPFWSLLSLLSLCRHHKLSQGYRKDTIRFFTVPVKVVGIGTNFFLRKGLKKRKRSKIKVPTKWSSNLQSIYDNLRCVKNPRFVPLQTLLRLSVRLFTTCVKVAF